MEIGKLLQNRPWLRRTWPFPHVVARNVFTRPAYDGLAGQMQEILARGLSEEPTRDQFSRSIPGYDAYGIAFDRVAAGPLALFLQPAWRDLVSRLFDVTVTPYVFAGAHHHSAGSSNGFIHNDLNPVWFPRTDRNAIQTPDHLSCSYRTGVGSLDESAKIQVVRGAALIFFLLNDRWHPGDGGETGLYVSARCAVSQPTLRVRPENNSLVAFECTPNSYHAFLSNARLPRTSIIMWVHRPLEEAVRRHGAEHLERWKQ